MPHTSHKKKQPQKQPSLSRNKRGEIKTDDGWTRIARSDKALSSNTADDEGFCHVEMHPPDNRDYDPDKDEGSTQMIYYSRPASIPDGATLEKAISHYQACETTWKNSNTFAELKKLFDSQINEKVPSNIDTCICFGLSSPTGLLISGADRRNVSLYQLALFTSVIDILSSKRGGKRPEAFAQEPIYNTLDIALHSHLGIKVVEHPEAFNLITRNTFAFCPGAEQDVVRGTLHRSPAMYMGTGALETYEDPQTGAIRSPEIGATFSEDYGKGDEEVLKEYDEEYREEVRKVMAEDREQRKKKVDADAIKGAGILHTFKRTRASFRLPDFEGHDYALYDTHLFWSNFPN